MIDPAFLDELDRFRTMRKRNLASRYEGERETRELGEGRTFSDYRRYAPGDDTRLIDWNVYARTNELHVKQFEAERNFTVHVLVDSSRSMAFGGGEENKFEFAAKLGLGFAYVAAAEHNDFQFSTVLDRSDRLDGGRSTRGEILALIDRCNATTPAGSGEFGDALVEYADRIRSRSMVLVVSDFLTDVDAVGDGLLALSEHDVVLGHVVAPGELDPPVRGDTVFEDMESDRELRTYFGSRTEHAYRDRVEAHIASVGGRADAVGARHHRVVTGGDFFDVFSRVWAG